MKRLSLADQERVLPDHTGAGGPWSTDVVPYLREPVDALSDPEVTELVFVKPARIGYTEGVIGNGIGYFIDQEPCAILVVQPTLEDARDWSKKDLAPMLEDSPALASKFSGSGARDPDNTILDKLFPGGSIAARGAKSPSGLRRLTARVVLMDEYSSWDTSIGSEGHPGKLAERAARTFANRKIVKGSTPKLKGTCLVSQDYERSDQRVFEVPCPHCDERQVLKWGRREDDHGLHWEKEIFCRGCGVGWDDEAEECGDCGPRDREVRHQPETAHYVCRHCGGAIQEVDKDEMVARGVWRPTNPGAPVRGYWMNALYSPFDGARGSTLVQEWLDAQQKPELLQVFWNQVLGLPWEGTPGERVPTSEFEARAEVWVDDDGEPVPVPRGVGILTAGVDVQEDRLELLVRGWGVEWESWVISHERIYGNVVEAATWSRLEALLTQRWRHASGRELRIQAAMVDSGAFTDPVYDFVHPRQDRNVWAAKGDAGKPGSAPVSRGQKAGREGIKLFRLGVYTLKDRLFNDLRRSRPGPRYIHFCQPTGTGADAEFYAQFSAHKKVTQRVKGGQTYERRYVQVRTRDEAIDLMVLSHAALEALGAGVTQHLDAWVDAANADPEPEQPPPTSTRRSNWATGGLSTW